MYCYRGVFYSILVLFLLGLLPATETAGQATSPGEAAASLPVEVDADKLEYDTERQILRAIGHVVVRRGDQVLMADFAEVERETQVVHARGHVLLQRAHDSWEGEELTYNFLTQEGDFGEFDAHVEAFYIEAAESERVADDEIRLKKAVLTTCEGDRPDYRIKASEARITDGDTLRAKHVVFFLGPVPVFYLPYVKRSLRDSNLDLAPGYSRAMGAYLLTAYNYPIGSTFSGATHLDYRARRGMGYGQDILWKDPEGKFEGGLRGYYIDDKEPFEDEEEEALLSNLIDNQRGRIRLSDYHEVNDRAYTLAEVNWLSDPDVLEDFFDEEFRNVAQPENRVSLTHRGDWYTAGLLVNKKLNDFFDNVDRLPEVTFDIRRQRIADSRFYYEGDHSLAFLKRDFADEVPEGSTPLEDYESFRLDLPNTVLYPTRHFDFLNVIPRVGYRATSYSQTDESITTTGEVVTVGADGITPVTTQVVTVTPNDGPGEIRNLFELGMENSFKGFSVWHEDPLWSGFRGLRHVIEPYSDYTFRPTPSLEPEEIYQFDSIDALDKANQIDFGVRNKFQTKRGKRILHDLVNADLFTTYFFDPDEDIDQNEFGPLGWDIELRPQTWLALDTDGFYDYQEGVLDKFNSQLGIVARDNSRVGLEYRFQEDVRNQIAPEIDLFPNARWSFSTYWRYNLDEDQLDEQEYFVRTKTRCLGVGLGYRHIAREGKDDEQVWGQVWLLAFPESKMDLGR